MYKLILVDDEEEVRKGILNKIEWHKYGFQVVGEAENGIEALEIAEKCVPDVVITDIKMPFMDGLQLSEKIKAKFPTVKIVILTGFDEFEYAKKAIKLNVVEYVLKPISSKELIEVLEKVKSNIDDEMAKKKDMDMLRDYYKKSLPVLKEKFLGSLITRRVSMDEIADKCRTYGINLEGYGFAAALLDMAFNDAAGSDGDGANDNNGFKADEKELTRLAVLNITGEIIDKYKTAIAFLHNDYIVIIFRAQSDCKDDFINSMLSILDEIRQSILVYYNLTVTIGVGTYCTSIGDIAYSYDNAVSALDYSLILGKNRVIYIEDVEPKRISRVVFDELKERSLISCIKVGSVDEIKDTVDSLFKELMDTPASINDCQIYLLSILTAILKMAKDLNVDTGSVFMLKDNLFVELYKLRDLDEAKKWILGICIKVRGCVSKERQDSCRQIAEKAAQYVKDNYSDCEITIERVCKHLHISPAYFSTIFKREMKTTFLNYLINVRMEAARELLRTTNLKTLEIAKMVGYSEPNYFSYCFKKNFKISPTEYRNSRS